VANCVDDAAAAFDRGEVETRKIPEASLGERAADGVGAVKNPHADKERVLDIV
jgi:hypothetical protein